MTWKKVKGWYEAMGLAILLFAFGRQSISAQTK